MKVIIGELLSCVVFVSPRKGRGHREIVKQVIYLLCHRIILLFLTLWR